LYLRGKVSNYSTVRSFVSGERPYIYAADPDTRAFTPAGAQAVYPEAAGVALPRIDCTFANLGRMSGVIKVVRGEITIGAIPDTPQFAYSQERLGTIIARPDTSTEPIQFSFNRNLTADEIAMISTGNLPFFFFGYIKYTDVFGYLITKGFCFRFRLGNNAISELVGGRIYNYTKYQKTPPEFET
jgi:hypothetical protein